MNLIEYFNQQIFLNINAPADASQFMISVAHFFAQTLPTFTPVILIALWLYGDERSRELVLKTVFVFAVAMLLNLLVHTLWFHPRPFMIHLGTNFLHHGPDSSFPSDHMTTASAVAWTFVLGRKRAMAVLFTVLALTVGWARVYLGVHFPLDIMGSVVVAGVACAGLASLWPKISAFVLPAALKAYRELLAWPIAKGWVGR